MNKEKLTAIFNKMAIALGVEADSTLPPVEETPATEPATETEVAPATGEVVEEKPQNEELTQMQEMVAKMEERLKNLEVQLSATTEAKVAAEAESAKLKAELSAIENTPADGKVVLSGTPPELTPAQKMLASLRAQAK